MGYTHHGFLRNAHFRANRSFFAVSLRVEICPRENETLQIVVLLSAVSLPTELSCVESEHCDVFGVVPVRI